MRDVLEAKLKEFREFTDVRPEAKRWLEDSNLWMGLYTLLCLRSVRVDRKDLVKILKGQILENINIELYGFCHRFRSVYREMISFVEMQADLDGKLLDRWYSNIFQPGEGELHRRDNAVVYDIGFIPCHFREINERMGDLFRKARGARDAAHSSAVTHFGLVEIYPYGKNSVSMALIAGMYMLMQGGIPVASYPLSEDEYSKLMSGCINGRDTEPFFDMHYRSLVNRLETVLRVYESAGEAQIHEEEGI